MGSALTVALLTQAPAPLAQNRLDAPAGTRVVQVQTIPALADYARARAAEADGYDELAVASYRQMLPYATDPAVAGQIFRTSLLVGDTNTALAAIRPFSDMSALPMEAVLLKISEAIRAGRWGEARQLTDTIADNTPFDFMVPSLKAWIAVGAKEADPFQHLNGLKQGSLEYNYGQRTRALISAMRGARAETVAAAKSTILMGQDSIMLRFALADRLTVLGAKDEALSLLDGDDPLFLAARSAFGSGKKVGTGVSNPSEGVAFIFSDLGAELAPEKVTALAVSMERMAQYLAPTNAVSPVLISNYLAAEGQDDLALRTLNAVKPKSPFYVAARMQRIDILLTKDRAAEAQTVARAWTKAEPKSPAAWEALGNALTASGNHEDAVGAYRQQLAVMPDRSDALWRPHFLIGNAEAEAGRWAPAQQSLNAALALSPKEPVILNALGYGMVENREDNEKAIGYLRTARMLDPSNPAYADSLGWAYVKSGDAARGVSILESAVKLAPGDPVFNEHLGDAYWLSGRKVDARYSWTAARVYADEKQRLALDARLRDGLPR